MQFFRMTAMRRSLFAWEKHQGWQSKSFSIMWPQKQSNDVSGVRECSSANIGPAAQLLLKITDSSHHSYCSRLDWSGKMSFLCKCYTYIWYFQCFFLGKIKMMSLEIRFILKIILLMKIWSCCPCSHHIVSILMHFSKEVFHHTSRKFNQVLWLVIHWQCCVRFPKCH